MSEYITLRDLALKSATDFLKLYEMVLDKQISVLPLHTKSVNMENGEKDVWRRCGGKYI